MIFIAPRLLSFLAWFKGHSKTAIAITVFPFIFVRSKEDVSSWLIMHERIHIQQQMELMLVGALVLYILETFYAKFILRLSSYEAYLYFSLEQEAYRNQNDPNYLKNRKLFTVLRYVMDKKKFLHKDGVVTYLW